MTDKEIAIGLNQSRTWAVTAHLCIHEANAFRFARMSVHIIHHIINSIDWEG